MRKIYENRLTKYWNPFRVITDEEYEMNFRTIVWCGLLKKNVRVPEKMTQRTAQIKKQCHK
jgi:hypothetical protein